MSMLDALSQQGAASAISRDTFGTPDELLENPADAFVAGFLGEANRLPCTVRGGVAHFEGDALPPG